MALNEQLAGARARLRYGQEDVAAALGVSRALISYWESGSRAPNDRQLAALSRLYHTPVGDFLGDAPIAESSEEARMLFRGADDVPDNALAGIEDFTSFLGTYAELAQAARFDIGGLHQSPFISRRGFDTDDDARRKAEEVRNHLRLGIGPIGDMDWVCELLGVTVYRAPLGTDLAETISGAFFNHPTVGFSILVNVEMTPGRRRFTIAHELAHAMFHSQADRFIVSTARKDSRERFADVFAGEFLMPSEAIRRLMEEEDLGRRITNATDVVHLQRFFKVSYATALVRLRQANLLNGEHYEEFKLVRSLALARALGYEVADEEYEPIADGWRTRRFPRRFIRLIRVAVAGDVVSVPTVANLTGLSITEVAALLSEPTSSQAPEGKELEEFEASGVLA